MEENVIPMVRPQKPISELETLRMQVKVMEHYLEHFDETLRMQVKVMEHYLDHFDPEWRKTLSDYLDKGLAIVESRA